MAQDALQREQRFEKFIAVLIALTTIFTAATTFFEYYASNQAQTYDRLAQGLSIEATTERINGALRFSYDWQGAFQTWRELDLMARNASQVGDTERAERYRAARDQLLGISPILEPPYFDEASEWTNALAYEADLYVVDSTRLWEEFENKSETSNTWDQFASAFVLQLTLYAVALSLFGLSTTIHNLMRWMFVGLASLIVLINLLWGMYILLIPIEEVPAAAIDAYARGIGLNYQGRDSEAIQAFDEAVRIHPDYANAIYSRGFSKLVIGDYTGAAVDFEATLAAGKRDTNVLWNLGWAYYLLGRFDDAIAVNQQALAIDPTLIGVRMNQGLTMLAQGRFGNAGQEYWQMLVEAERQVTEARARNEAAPWSLWYFLDIGTADIQSLLDQAAGSPKAWTQAPEAGRIQADSAELQQNGLAEIRRIKEYLVALELFGRPPLDSPAISVSEFNFVQEVYDQNGNFLEYRDAAINEYGINEIGIQLDYSGFEDGMHELWKVYLNGTEDTALRVVTQWAAGESGTGIKWITYAFSNVFMFLPGEFTVELYIDTRLVQTGTFWVLAP